MMMISIGLFRENIGKIQDELSRKVQHQYEEQPYPSWVSAGIMVSGVSIAEHCRYANLKLKSDIIKSEESPQILVAGCGTGQHSVSVSAYFKNSQVTAIDLSLPSLAYAKQKSIEYGRDNITYYQGDLLEVGNLNKTFDIIECAGVLHHMKRPKEGWQTLTKCLKTGGLMKIALYSEHSRAGITKIRKEFPKLTEGLSKKEILEARDLIIQSKESHHRSILYSNDFYGVNSLRDLLFNIQEHQFNIPLISEYLSDLGLWFCGFEDPIIMRKFKEEFRGVDDEYNLEKWHELKSKTAALSLRERAILLIVAIVLVMFIWAQFYYLSFEKELKRINSEITQLQQLEYSQQDELQS